VFANERMYGSRGIAPLFLNRGAGWWVLNITPLLLYADAHSTEGWVGPRADRGSWRFWRRIFCATTGIRTPDSTAGSLDSVRDLVPAPYSDIANDRKKKSLMVRISLLNRVELLEATEMFRTLRTRNERLQRRVLIITAAAGRVSKPLR